MEWIFTLSLLLAVLGISAQTQKDDATLLQLSGEVLPIPVAMPFPVPVFVPVSVSAQDEPQKTVQEAPLDDPTQDILFPSERLNKLREWITKEGEILEEKRKLFEKHRHASEKDLTDSEVANDLVEHMDNIDPGDGTDPRAQEPGWTVFDHAHPEFPGCSKVAMDMMENFVRFSDEDNKQMVMRHAGAAVCVGGNGLQKLSFRRKSKAHTDFVLKVDAVKTRLEISVQPLLNSRFKPSAYAGENSVEGLVMIPDNMMEGPRGDWEKGDPLPHRLGEWMTSHLAAKRDPNHEDTAGAKGNVFGGFGRLILKQSMKAPLMDSSVVPTQVASNFGIIPFKLDDENDHVGMRWPGGGLMSNFQFVNSWSNGDWFAQPVDSFEYVRNFILNDETQGSAFIEYHDFPHVFVPQGDRTTGRVLLAAVVGMDRFTFSELDKTTQSYQGTFEFMEIRIHFQHGLLCGGSCLHSDSATSGPIFATCNPITKFSDTSFLRSEMEGKILGKSFNPYEGIPDGKFDASDVLELKYEERFKDPEARKAFKKQWAADLIKEAEVGLKGAVAMS